MSRLVQWLRDLSRVDVVVLCFLIRFGYVFGYSDYQAYLTGDWAGFWKRAGIYAQGHYLDPALWCCWPPAYQNVLGVCMRLFSWLSLPSSVWLGTVLLVQIFLCSVGAWCVYDLARSALGPVRGSLVALAYAWCWPLVYLSAFVASENLAIPLMLGAVWCVVCGKDEPLWRVAAGAVLALATAIRPNLGLFILPFLVYLYCIRREWLRPGLFLAPFAVILLVVCIVNSVQSGGQLRGLSSNGGADFFYGQEKPKVLRCVYWDQHHTYWDCYLASPNTWHSSGLTVTCPRPWSDNGYYYLRGLRLLRYARTWARDLDGTNALYWGYLYPDSPGRWSNWDGVWQIGAALGAFCGFWAVPLAWLRCRSVPAAVWLCWGFGACVWVTGFLFCAERRYTLPVLWCYFLMAVWCCPSLSRVRSAWLVSARPYRTLQEV